MTEVSKIEKNLDPDIYKHLKSLLYKQSALATKHSEDPEYQQTPCPAGPTTPVVFCRGNTMLSGGSACGHKSREPGSGLLRPTVQRRNLELHVGYGHLVVPSKPISGETATTQKASQLDPEL